MVSVGTIRAAGGPDGTVQNADRARSGRQYFDLGRNASYEAARRGDIPTIRIGRLARGCRCVALERLLEQTARSEMPALQAIDIVKYTQARRRRGVFFYAPWRPTMTGVSHTDSDAYRLLSTTCIPIQTSSSLRSHDQFNGLIYSIGRSGIRADQR